MLPLVEREKHADTAKCKTRRLIPLEGRSPRSWIAAARSGTPNTVPRKSHKNVPNGQLN